MPQVLRQAPIIHGWVNNMPNIPHDTRIENPGGISHGNTVNRNYGMRGLALNDDIAAIDNQTANMMGRAMNNAFSTGTKIYKQHKEGQNAADLAAAKMLTLDYERQMAEDIRQVNDPAEIAKITKAYDEKINTALKGKNADGIPYFRNEEARKLFSEKYLTERVGGWHRNGSETAFQMDQRNSKARLQLDIDGAMKADNLDDPEIEQTINENLDQLSKFGVPAAEIQLRKSQQLAILDKKRVERHTQGFQNQVEGILASEDLTPKGKDKAVKAEIERYSGYINNLKGLTPAEKETFTDRLDASLKMVENMVKSDQIAKQKQLKAMQEGNELNVLRNFQKQLVENGRVDYRAIAAQINELPASAFDASFIKEINSELEKQIELEQEQYADTIKEMTAGATDFAKQVALQQQDKYDYQTLNAIMDYNGSDPKIYRNLVFQVGKMQNTDYKSKANALLGKKDPEKFNATKKDDRSSVIGKQLDNILGFNLTASQKKHFGGESSTDRGFWKDDDERYMDDNGVEVFDGLTENERLELRYNLMEDYTSMYVDNPEKAQAWIKEQMTTLEKSVNDVKYFKNYAQPIYTRKQSTRQAGVYKSGDKFYVDTEQGQREAVQINGKWQYK